MEGRCLERLSTASTLRLVAPLAVTLLMVGCGAEVGALKPADLVGLTASAETEPVASSGDAADDPAIWIHPTDPSKSVIIGTDKRAGLNVYDLSGRHLQFVDSGWANNVDLRYGLRLNGRDVDLVAASNRSFNGVDLYVVDAESRRLLDVSLNKVSTDLADIYGLCMGRDPSNGIIYVYANSRDGTVYQYRAVARGEKVGMNRVRALKVATQVEGCVVDDRSGQLFLAEEQRGIWRFDAWPDGGRHGRLIARAGDHGLAPDIEGLAAFPLEDGGYLLASSQGNSSFAVFDLESPHEHLGGFEIVDGTAVDGVAETDGLDVTPVALPGYSTGLLVVQDGYNTAPDAHQNFKLVDWAKVAAALGLETHADYKPR